MQIDILLWRSLPDHYSFTDMALLAETSALKGTHILFLFVFTAAGAL